MSRSPNPGSKRLCTGDLRSSVEADVSKYCQPTLFEEPSAVRPRRPDRVTIGSTGRREAVQDEERYVGKRELDQRYPVSVMTRWRWMNDPNVSFPKPVKLGPNGRNFWWLPEILEWERRRAAVRSVEEAAR
jgi:predicted DNA-binding transcriptional regulator AlpA